MNLWLTVWNWFRYFSWQLDEIVNHQQCMSTCPRVTAAQLGWRVLKLRSYRHNQGSAIQTIIPSNGGHADPVKRLLEHLTESGNYSRKDLAPLENTLVEMRRNIEHGRPHHNELIVSMVEFQVNASEVYLKTLMKKLESVSMELELPLERLVCLRRSIKACESKQKVQRPLELD